MPYWRTEAVGEEQKRTDEDPPEEEEEVRMQVAEVQVVLEALQEPAVVEAGRALAHGAAQTEALY